MMISKAILIAIVIGSCTVGALATAFVVPFSSDVECGPAALEGGSTFQQVQPRRGPSKGY